MLDADFEIISVERRNVPGRGRIALVKAEAILRPFRSYWVDADGNEYEDPPGASVRADLRLVPQLRASFHFDVDLDEPGAPRVGDILQLGGDYAQG